VKVRGSEGDEDLAARVYFFFGCEDNGRMRISLAPSHIKEFRPDDAARFWPKRYGHTALRHAA